MRINIVIDNKNSWFFEKKDELIKSIRKLGHTVKYYSNPKLLPLNSDITFFLSCEDYITKKMRNKSRFNIVVHASDLPKGKGMSPTTWQILEGKKRIPITLFEVADGFDTGEWYIKDGFTLRGDELIDEWQEKLNACIAKMILKFIKSAKSVKPIKQRGKETVYKRRSLEDSELSTKTSIESQFNLLRVVDNERYPAFFKHKGKKYIIKIYKENL